MKMRGIRRVCSSCESLASATAQTTGKGEGKQQHQHYGSIEYASTAILIDASECTPLLKRSSQKPQKCGYCKEKYAIDQPLCRPCCDLRLMAIVFIFLTGLFIATYLLFIETQMPALRFSLDLVNHDIWSDVATHVPLGGLLNHTNVVNVIITHTGGKHCQDYEECGNVLREMQKRNADHEELPYNFMIGGDMQTYEVRGWKYLSGLTGIPQNISLVIGFIGNYTFTKPKFIQLQSALSLIKESVRRKKLQRLHQIYGLRNLTNSLLDAEELFKCTAEWKNFNTLLHVF